MQTKPCFAAGKSAVLCLRKTTVRAIKAQQTQKKNIQSDPLWKLEVTQPEDGCFQMTREGNEEAPTLSKRTFAEKDACRSAALGFVCSAGSRASFSPPWRVRTVIPPPPRSLLSSSRRSRKVTLRTVQTAPARPRPSVTHPLPLTSQQHGTL